MKILRIILMLLLPLHYVSAQNLSPYILGFETTESISNVNKNLLDNLEQNGLKVVGHYQPANDKNRLIIIISSLELESAVKK
ncbi:MULTISPECIES: hypothetical protein [unclassified Flavobacterium]|jgi:hypothetical protein|uniref:hypothetical protein n=1 Tax=unclassified Flavobacterium TaxID=196869 RepID=UPI0025C0A22F|nr:MULTISPECIES: hypothetical protein [unclassified Flavobacterium]